MVSVLASGEQADRQVSPLLLSSRGRLQVIMAAFSPNTRSNLMGTKFTVYDHGVNPVKAQGLVEKAHTRQELAAICYVSAPLASPSAPRCALLHACQTPKPALLHPPSMCP